VQGEKDQRRRRVAADQLGQAERGEQAAPAPCRDDAGGEQRHKYETSGRVPAGHPGTGITAPASQYRLRGILARGGVGGPGGWRALFGWRRVLDEK